ncbi:MAG: hypothetical protein R3D57_03575 [Hyphomicrobiaceae bacterium]
MFRTTLACLALAICVAPIAPASADMKIIAVKTANPAAAPAHIRNHRQSRHMHATAFAVPHCRLEHRSKGSVHWRGLHCPKIAWAGSAPRQPWSYDVFRRHAVWEQQSRLWQSHIRPSATHPTIYWGY